MTAIASPINYFGGKSLLAERLVASFPAHKHFVEPCGGSLAVLLAKPRSSMETVNDLDGSLMCFWKVLRDRPTELERVCSLTPHSRAERELSHNISADLDDLERARRVWVALTQGRSGTLRKTGWRFDAAAVSTPVPVRMSKFAGRLAPAAARLHGVSLECRPAIEVVRTYGKDRNTLLYVDPPYAHSSGRAKNYAVEMTDAVAAELATAVVDCAAAVVVSGYASPIWDVPLSDWYRYEISSYTTQGGAHGERVEIVWSNRPLSGLGDTAGSITKLDSSDGTKARCLNCFAIVRQPKTGRKRTWCSPACRQAAWKVRRDAAGDTALEEGAA